MADKMFITIVLRKEVPDRVAGRAIFDLVKARLEDRPDIKVNGNVTNHFKEEGEPS